MKRKTLPKLNCKFDRSDDMSSRSSNPLLAGLLTALTLAFAPGFAGAHGNTVVPHRAAALEVRGELPPPPAGTSSIKFGEFFQMPVGPLGLEPSEKLTALNGKRVRLVGYMVQEDTPTTGRFLLSPLPVSLGDEDESLSDDLPPTTVFVHLQGAGNHGTPFIPGLIKLNGILEVGNKDEGEGRISAVRLILDPALSKRILGAKPMVRTAKK